MFCLHDPLLTSSLPGQAQDMPPRCLHMSTLLCSLLADNSAGINSDGPERTLSASTRNIQLILLLQCVHHADNGQSRKQSDWAGMDVEAPPDRSYSVSADCVTHLRMKSVGWTVRTSKCRLFRREFLIPFRLEGYSRASLTSTCKWTNTNVGKIGSWLCLWQWTILLTIMIEWCGDF